MKEELNSNSVGIEKQEQMSVFILQLMENKYVVEFAADMKKRIRFHQKGKCEMTAKFRPVKLIFFVSIEGRQEARKLVYRIARVGAEYWLKGLRTHELKYVYD